MKQNGCEKKQNNYYMTEINLVKSTRNVKSKRQLCLNGDKRL
jgi:hypothetical protein